MSSSISQASQKPFECPWKYPLSICRCWKNCVQLEWLSVCIVRSVLIPLREANCSRTTKPRDNRYSCNWIFTIFSKNLLKFGNVVIGAYFQRCLQSPVLNKHVTQPIVNSEGNILEVNDLIHISRYYIGDKDVAFSFKTNIGKLLYYGSVLLQLEISNVVCSNVTVYKVKWRLSLFILCI